MLNLYNKDYTTKYGTINSVIEAFVEEERNGLFELSFIMLNTDSLFNYIKEDNIVVANANNTLVNQKFRIYMTRKLMNNRVEVFARHISFDLMYDYIDNISFENQSCEYALNQLFRSSQFSKHYKGYSNIVNAQNYSMSMANVLEAIGGKEGSLLDTFGTGAELLRDNENIHILNKRGYDNSVSIEYKKNLTGFELEEDTTDLVTRILPYARYTPEGGEEVIVKASFVDSPLIANYSHPFVKAIDYTDKFEEGEEVITSKLITFAQNEYKVNKVDMPKQNFKIEFIPLSKCIGFEGLEDNISLCDTVTIKDARYNINTQSKVIKTTFNVLKNRYESMELGEPRTSLGDIIGNNDSTKGEKGDKGDKGDKGEDGNIGDFPNSLPSTPVVTTKVYGFANIEISWTFENKVYYQYEVYASKEANFTPNSFNLIHSGQTSTYMYQAKPNETWYFKVCAINTHGNRTSFGSAYATTVKIDDLSNYVEEMAIDDALIGTLKLDRGWVGELKGNYIDARNLSVTDGNGKRTLDIDSFGNVSINASSIKMSVSNSNTTLDSWVNETQKDIEDVNKGIELSMKGVNLAKKTKDLSSIKLNGWIIEASTLEGFRQVGISTTNTGERKCELPIYADINTLTSDITISYEIYSTNDEAYALGFAVFKQDGQGIQGIGYIPISSHDATDIGNGWRYVSYTFNPNDFGINNKSGAYEYKILFIKMKDTTGQVYISIRKPKLEIGSKATPWTLAPQEIANEIDVNISEVKSQIDQTANGIISSVESNYYNKSYINNELNWLNTESSRIEQKADKISSEVSKKVGQNEVKTIIQQDANSVNIGFNNISKAIQFSNGAMFFRDYLNRQRLSLMNGSLYAYNYIDNTFLGGFMPYVTQNNTYKGIGVTGSSHCQSFTVGYANGWNGDDFIEPVGLKDYLTINFKDRGSNIEDLLGIHCYAPLFASGGIDMRSSRIYNCSSLTTINAYIDNYYSNITQKIMFRSDGNDMFNGANWDWQGHNILNPVIIGGSYGYSVINNAKEVSTLNLEYEADTLTEIEVVSILTEDNTKTLDVSNVTNKEEIMLDKDNVDLSKLVTLLISEVKKLKNEIEDLKSSNLKD